MSRWPDADTRFVNNILIEEQCWQWLGALSLYGYGLIRWQGRQVPVHRYAYERFVGPIPDGLHVDHLCRNTSCVNPAHLEPVTPSENSRRRAGTQPLVESCPNGHGYTPENTGLDRGFRYCRECKRQACARQYRLRQERKAQTGSHYAHRPAGDVCKWGHELTPDNTYVRPDGRRRCRVCIRAERAKSRARRAAKEAADAA